MKVLLLPAVVGASRLFGSSSRQSMKCQGPLDLLILQDISVGMEDALEAMEHSLVDVGAYLKIEHPGSRVGVMEYRGSFVDGTVNDDSPPMMIGGNDACLDLTTPLIPWNEEIHSRLYSTLSLNNVPDSYGSSGTPNATSHMTALLGSRSGEVGWKLDHRLVIVMTNSAPLVIDGHSSIPTDPTACRADSSYYYPPKVIESLDNDHIVPAILLSNDATDPDIERTWRDFLTSSSNKTTQLLARCSESDCRDALVEILTHWKSTYCQVDGSSSSPALSGEAEEEEEEEMPPIVAEMKFDDNNKVEDGSIYGLLAPFFERRFESSDIERPTSTAYAQPPIAPKRNRRSVVVRSPPSLFNAPPFDPEEDCLEGPIDVMLLMDATNGLQDTKTNLVKAVRELAEYLDETHPGSRLGLISFQDKPVPEMGTTVDYCTKVDADLTSDYSQVIDRLDRLICTGGCDAEEGQYMAILRAARDPSISWRRVQVPPTSPNHSTGRYMLLITDDRPHYGPGSKVDSAEKKTNRDLEEFKDRHWVDRDDRIWEGEVDECLKYDYPSIDEVQASLFNNGIKLGVLLLSQEPKENLRFADGTANICLQYQMAARQLYGGSVLPAAVAAYQWLLNDLLEQTEPYLYQCDQVFCPDGYSLFRSFIDKAHRDFCDSGIHTPNFSQPTTEETTTTTTETLTATYTSTNSVAQTATEEEPTTEPDIDLNSTTEDDYSSTSSPDRFDDFFTTEDPTVNTSEEESTMNTVEPTMNTVEESTMEPTMETMEPTMETMETMEPTMETMNTMEPTMETLESTMNTIDSTMNTLQPPTEGCDDGPIDLLIILDTTDGLKTTNENVGRAVEELLTYLEETHPGSKVGLLEFRDKPVPNMGTNVDFCGRVVVDLMHGDSWAVPQQMQTLPSAGGCDLPEAHFTALMGAARDPGVGWRRVEVPATKPSHTTGRYAILITDSEPHVYGDARTHTDETEFPEREWLDRSEKWAGWDRECEAYEYPTQGEVAEALLNNGINLGVLLVPTTSETARLEDLVASQQGRHNCILARQRAMEEFGGRVDPAISDAWEQFLSDPLAQEEPYLYLCEDLYCTNPFNMLRDFVDQAHDSVCTSGTLTPDFSQAVSTASADTISSTTMTAPSSETGGYSTASGEMSTISEHSTTLDGEVPTTSSFVIDEDCLGGPIDLLIVQDVTAGLQQTNANVAESIKAFLNYIEVAHPGSHVGLLSFRDKPVPNMGSSVTDYCGKLEVNMMGEGFVTEIPTVMADLMATGGCDIPEAQFVALMGGARDPEIAWRRVEMPPRSPQHTTGRYMILITDSKPHLIGDATSMTDKDFKQDWLTRVETWLGWETECKQYEYPHHSDVAAALLNNGIHLGVLLVTGELEESDDEAIVASDAYETHWCNRVRREALREYGGRINEQARAAYAWFIESALHQPSANLMVCEERYCPESADKLRQFIEQSHQEVCVSGTPTPDFSQPTEETTTTNAASDITSAPEVTSTPVVTSTLDVTSTLEDSSTPEESSFSTFSYGTGDSTSGTLSASTDLTSSTASLDDASTTYSLNTADESTTDPNDGGDGSTTDVTDGDDSTTDLTDGDGSTTDLTDGDGSTTDLTDGDGSTTDLTDGDGSTTDLTDGDGSTTDLTDGDGSTSDVTGGDGSTTDLTDGDGSTTDLTDGDDSTTDLTDGDGSTSDVTGGDGSTTDVTGGDGSTSEVTGGDGSSSTGPSGGGDGSSTDPNVEEPNTTTEPDVNPSSPSVTSSTTYTGPYRTVIMTVIEEVDGNVGVILGSTLGAVAGVGAVGLAISAVSYSRWNSSNVVEEDEVYIANTE